MGLPNKLHPTLKKAISESYSTNQYNKFQRIEGEYTAVKKTKIAHKLIEYRKDGKSMEYAELLSEDHSSKQLGKFMRAASMPRPGLNWEAHHMVSGGHKEAALARTILADDDIKIRIDDPVNGCWMPKTKSDARPTLYPNAIGHNRIHREKYYNWITNRLAPISDPNLLAASLAAVRSQLMQGNISEEYLVKEIDGVEIKDWYKRNR